MLIEICHILTKKCGGTTATDRRERNFPFVRDTCHYLEFDQELTSRNDKSLAVEHQRLCLQETTFIVYNCQKVSFIYI